MNQNMNVIKSRYQIFDILGEGGVGTTYKAKDLQTDHWVALKIISFRQTSDWKTLDLFEREGRVLRQLDHPAIPKYLDSFQVDSESDRLFCLVQEFAPGQSLDRWIASGWRPDENEVRAIATQLLEILIYLQHFTPPILHRDLKPQNILRDQQGQIYLVDFGAVQDTYRQTVTGGSTVVGTFGYMAPEQYRGQATLATDLYGLGTTLVFLLTGKDPIDLPQTDDLKLKLPADVKLSSHCKRWLERLISPAVESRFASAEIAIAALQGNEQVYQTHDSTQRPRNTKILLIRTEDCLRIRFQLAHSSHLAVLGLWVGSAFCGLWIVLVLLMLWLSKSIEVDTTMTNPDTVTAFTIVIFMASMISTTFLITACRTLQEPTTILIDQKKPDP
ncbi:serine/threonine protein kinase [bacterium]|nr:serine/threonine protein kinase [bacterium]